MLIRQSNQINTKELTLSNNRKFIRSGRMIVQPKMEHVRQPIID